MKTSIKLIASMAMMLCAVAFTSCDDDNDDKTSKPAAKEVAGTYKGDMTCAVAGSESVFEDVTFILTAADDAKTDITISTYGNPPMQVPGFTIKGVKVYGENGKYALAPTEYTETLANQKVAKGAIKGDYDNGTLNLTFTLQYGAMPMIMTNTFSATKE